MQSNGSVHNSTFVSIREKNTFDDQMHTVITAYVSIHSEQHSIIMCIRQHSEAFDRLHSLAVSIQEEQPMYAHECNP